jgi:hypothetical protein
VDEPEVFIVCENGLLIAYFCAEESFLQIGIPLALFMDKPLNGRDGDGHGQRRRGECGQPLLHSPLISGIKEVIAVRRADLKAVFELLNVFRVIDRRRLQVHCAQRVLLTAGACACASITSERGSSWRERGVASGRQRVHGASGCTHGRTRSVLCSRRRSCCSVL